MKRESQEESMDQRRSDKILERLRAAKGDMLYVLETPTGSS